MMRTAKAWLAIVLLLVLSGCGARVELMSSIPEEEANQILSTLLDAGIPAEKTVNKTGVTISVDSHQAARSLDVLRAHGLPRERFAGIGDVFRKEGLVSSPLEERARYIYALSQELGNTLSKMDGVLVARVHVVLPERGQMGDAATPATAAVFVKHRAGYNLDALQPQIRKMVSNSIPGLEPERVSIVLVASQAPATSVRPAWESVLGIRVAPDSRGAVIGLAVALVLALIVSGMAVGYLLWRRFRSTDVMQTLIERRA